MTLMKMSHHSLHCVIRTAAIAVQDSGFQLLQFLNMFPAQVLSRVHTITSTVASPVYMYDQAPDLDLLSDYAVKLESSC